MSTSSSSSAGIGFPGLLTVVFVTLKLCDVIDWSWWWVTSPLWGVIAFCVVVAVLILVGVGIYKCVFRKRKPRR